MCRYSILSFKEGKKILKNLFTYQQFEFSIFALIKRISFYKKCTRLNPVDSLLLQYTFGQEHRTSIHSFRSLKSYCCKLLSQFSQKLRDSIDVLKSTSILTALYARYIKSRIVLSILPKDRFIVLGRQISSKPLTRLSRQRYNQF